MNDGDWICSDPSCGNINFGKRQSCYRCNKERPVIKQTISTKKLGTEIGKSAAEKSRGLFNADDWQCSKCANVNWARRQTCNVCNAPKFGEVEARTGYGGGYNEREVVEYRRREPSSDDEYDEFGRKKRKRKGDSQEKVGISEGPVFKKVPPALLQNENKKEPDHAPGSVSFKTNNTEKVSGSFSDGSVCEMPPLSKTVFRRNQIQNQTSYYRQDHMLPNYRSFGAQNRKRFSSFGEKDTAGSSGYETGSRNSKRDSTTSPVSTYKNPVMENQVSSTNSLVYKFTGSTPVENFHVSYTIEERVRAAAFAITYNNCKISAERFESMFDKPAPDFKTIFAWRQCLLQTGCLVDSHVEAQIKSTPSNIPLVNNDLKTGKPEGPRIPNPDEIPIITDSDDESTKDSKIQACNNKKMTRSVSSETLVIVSNDNDSAATGGYGSSRKKSSSQTRSGSSSESQDSNYPDTDSEKKSGKKYKSAKSETKKNNSKNSHKDSESDSESSSYSTEGDFRSRVYGKSSKVMEKFEKTKKIVSSNQNDYPSPNTVFNPGYYTAKQPDLPLPTSNRYIKNSPVVNVKSNDNPANDTDGYSSEYVPTVVGYKTKNNYEQFKDNVRKKGFWAKGNSFSQNKNNSTPLKTIKGSQNIKPFYNKQQGYSTVKYPVDDKNNQSQIESLGLKDNKYANQPKVYVMPPKSPEDNSRIFDVVQSDCNMKNKSILDIFDLNDKKECAERKDTLEKYDNVQKLFESRWDEDDDALYKETDSQDKQLHDKYVSPEPFLTKSVTLSPTSFNLYSNESEITQKNNTKPEGQLDNIKLRRDELVNLLKEFQTNCQQEDTNSSAYVASPKKTCSLDAMKTSTESNKCSLTSSALPDGLPKDLSDEITSFSTSSKTNVTKIISPSKQVRVLETVIIKPKLKDYDLSDSCNEAKLNISDKLKKVQASKTISTSIKSGVQPISDNSHNIIDIQCNLAKAQENEARNSPLKKNIDIFSQPIVGQEISPKNLLAHISPCKPINTTEHKSLQVSQENDSATHNYNDSNDCKKKVEEHSKAAPQVDLANLLAGINTDTLLLALQNLKQLTRNPATDVNSCNSESGDLDQQHNAEDMQPVETINLTNDEEWERESNADNSIERQLEIMDGNTGDTPFLGDIFDPGPVVIPPNVAQRLNLPIPNPEDPSNENAPVIGNFKSFALPKPILLNRLKLTVKVPDKVAKKSEKSKRKKKTKSSTSQASEERMEAKQGQGEDDEEESGDEADLSKYDLWGSDEEKDTSSKSENKDNSKDTSAAPESNVATTKSSEQLATPDSNTSKRKRSRSSSSSSTSSSSSSSSQSSSQDAKNNERESSPGRTKRAGSHSPRRRKSRDSRSAGESRSSRDKDRSREREKRDKTRSRERKQRRYSRDSSGNHYSARGRHR